MKTLPIIAGMAGLLIAVTPAMSNGQGVTLGSRMPSAAPRHLVRYRYTYTKRAAGAEAKASEIAGTVDVASDDATLYYREYRDAKEYREVLENRKQHQVLLFNHQQNRLNLFSNQPYDATPFIPFPFDDEEMSRAVKLDDVKNRALSPGNKDVSLPGTLGETSNSVPVQLQATMTNTPSGPKVGKFSIRAPNGDVADWVFTYASDSGAHPLPAVITRTVAQPFMTEEEKQRLRQHEAVPPTHWRPDAEIRYTFVEDRAMQEGAVPTADALFRSANEQTTIVDRRDLKNPISFNYRKDGGDLETQVQAARVRAATAKKPGTISASQGTGGYVLFAPLALCLLAPLGLGVGWVIRRHIARPAKAQPS